MSALSCPISIRFPRVLERLDYEQRVSRREICVDGREVFQWYCSWATDGLKYERIVQSPENRAAPNHLVESNVSNLFNVRGRGWSWTIFRPMLHQPIPELKAIPVDASLFSSDKYDSALIECVNRYCSLPGIKLANATKLLYQKRPALIPILDEFARQAFDLPWLPGPANDFSQVLRRALRNLREFETLNARSLDQLQTWAEANAGLAGGLRFSRLRIIDILAWGVIKREEL